MGGPLSELQRIGLKLFLADGAAVRPRELVPVFHRWIQQGAVDGLLIDVADYEHVPEGPGAVLVAHEGNYSMDQADGRMGLLYYRKQPLGGALPERLLSLGRIVLRAARLLEEDADLGSRLRFRGDELQVTANDRLLAPNDEQTLAAFRPALEPFLAALYGEERCEIVRVADPRERFILHVKAPRPADVSTLLERLGVSSEGRDR
jgi:hypothetical protein